MGAKAAKSHFETIFVRILATYNYKLNNFQSMTKLMSVLTALNTQSGLMTLVTFSHSFLLTSVLQRLHMF